MQKNSRFTRRGKTVASLAAGLGLVASSLLGVGATAAQQSPAAPVATQVSSETGTINGYRNIGYFAQWGVYGRDFKLKQVQDSGTAQHLTHIQYAFCNIHHMDGTCFIANKAQGSGPNGSDGAGDAYADYEMGYTAANLVNGTTDATSTR